MEGPKSSVGAAGDVEFVSCFVLLGILRWTMCASIVRPTLIQYDILGLTQMLGPDAA